MSSLVWFTLSVFVLSSNAALATVGKSFSTFDYILLSVVLIFAITEWCDIVKAIK